MLKQVIYEKVTPIGYPDETHLPEHPKVYRYEKFPKFSQSLFSQKIMRQQTQDSQQQLAGLESSNKVQLDQVNLKSLDDDAWTLRLLEEIHTLWLVCLNLRAKFHNQPELYS